MVIFFDHDQNAEKCRDRRVLAEAGCVCEVAKSGLCFDQFFDHDQNAEKWRMWHCCALWRGLYSKW